MNENSISEDSLRDQSNGLIEDDEYARTSSEVYKEVQGGGEGDDVIFHQYQPFSVANR